MGLSRADGLRWRARLLPPAPSARQDPSSSPSRPRQSTRRDPSWLLGSPSDLPRRNRLAEVADGCCLTSIHRGMSRLTFARSLVPKFTALRRDLDRSLHYYNVERAHTGLRTHGRTPAAIVYGARKCAHD